MIQNAAFLAALTEFLLAAWLAQEVVFLAGVKHALFRQHGLAIGLIALLVFLHLFSAYYACARWLFLRETGRKLQHLDHQLATPDTALDDLRKGLQS